MKNGRKKERFSFLFWRHGLFQPWCSFLTSKSPINFCYFSSPPPPVPLCIIPVPISSPVLIQMLPVIAVFFSPGCISTLYPHPISTYLFLMPILLYFYLLLFHPSLLCLSVSLWNIAPKWGHNVLSWCTAGRRAKCQVERDGERKAGSKKRRELEGNFLVLKKVTGSK